MSKYRLSKKKTEKTSYFQQFSSDLLKCSTNGKLSSFSIRKRNFISIGRKITKNFCPKSMQLKSDKISPKNVDFPRSETNQQTDMRKINSFLLIFTSCFIIEGFMMIQAKLKVRSPEAGGERLPRGGPATFLRHHRIHC